MRILGIKKELFPFEPPVLFTPLWEIWCFPKSWVNITPIFLVCQHFCSCRIHQIFRTFFTSFCPLSVPHFFVFYSFFIYLFECRYSFFHARGLFRIKSVNFFENIYIFCISICLFFNNHIWVLDIVKDYSQKCATISIIQFVNNEMIPFVIKVNTFSRLWKQKLRSDLHFVVK